MCRRLSQNRCVGVVSARRNGSRDRLRPYCLSVMLALGTVSLCCLFCFWFWFLINYLYSAIDPNLF